MFETSKMKLDENSSFEVYPHANLVDVAMNRIANIQSSGGQTVREENFTKLKLKLKTKIKMLRNLTFVH